MEDGLFGVVRAAVRRRESSVLKAGASARTRNAMRRRRSLCIAPKREREREGGRECELSNYGS